MCNSYNFFKLCLHVKFIPKKKEEEERNHYKVG